MIFSLPEGYNRYEESTLKGYLYYWEWIKGLYIASPGAYIAPMLSPLQIYEADYQTYCVAGHETMPDIYTFDFGDHHGSFTFSGGEIHIFDTGDRPAGEYKVEFYMPGVAESEKRITITTGDGYRYMFEVPDEPELFDTTAPLQTGLVDPLAPDDYPTQWQLKTITAPNGDEVTFHYRKGTFANRKQTTSIRYYQVSYESEKVYPITGSPPPTPTHYSCELPTYMQLSRGKHWYLTSIDIRDDVRISFRYDAVPIAGREHYREHRDSLHKPLATLATLKSMRVERLGAERRVLRDCALSHQYENEYKEEYGSRAHVPVLYLKEINLYDVGRYKMQYGQYDTSGKRLLSQIHWPAGGKSTYEYEPHSYTQYVTRSGSADGLPYLRASGKTTTANGMRIKAIGEENGMGQIRRRTYHYSGGTLLQDSSTPQDRPAGVSAYTLNYKTGETSDYFSNRTCENVRFRRDDGAGPRRRRRQLHRRQLHGHHGALRLREIDLHALLGRTRRPDVGPDQPRRNALGRTRRQWTDQAAP